MEATAVKGPSRGAIGALLYEAGLVQLDPRAKVNKIRYTAEYSAAFREREDLESLTVGSSDFVLPIEG
jgi:hypothetical protein